MLSQPDILNPTLYRLLEIFQLNKVYVRGEGHYLFDQEGRSYLDFIAQYGAVPFGYNPPFIWEAVYAFHRTGMPTLVQPSVPPKAVELAEKLSELTPGRLQYATFVQSGAESVEAAIKLARSATGRFKILSTENGFHGKTLGALSATGREVYQKPFHAPVPGFIRVPYGDLSALERTLQRQGKDIAGFIVEPIQGEGGIIVPPSGYLRAAQELCRRFGVVFILDEIQTGLGRTGRLFASEKEQLEPDIMLLSKALGGGLVPLGVCLSTPETWNDDYGRLHSSTFSNNNLTCAIGLAVIDRLLADNRSILDQIKKKGQYLLDKALEIQKRWPGVIKEVRGEGLLVGIEFADFSSADSWDMIFLSKQGRFCPLLSGFLLNVYGIRCAPFLNSPFTIRLEPTLTIEYSEIDAVLEALDRICEIVYLKDYAKLFRFLVGDNRPPRRVADYRQQTMREVRFSQLKPGEKPTRKFAFIIHYPGISDLINATPSFEQWSEAELEDFLEWQSSDPEPEVICHLPAIRSRSGEVAEGWLIAVPCGAKQMKSRPRQEMVKVIQQAVDLAVEMGAQIVGLGAYTSVVSRGGRDVQGRGVVVTSGNGYTIAMAVEALIQGAEKMRIDLETAQGAVVGAAGSIGRVCAILLSERVSHLNLIGNPAHKVSSMRRLRTVADEIIRHCWKHRESGKRQGMAGWLDRTVGRLNSLHNEEAAELLRQFMQSLAGGEELRPYSVVEKMAKFLNEAPPITITVDLKRGMRTADLIITASNSPGFLVTSDCLKTGAVLCDVSRPQDVLPTVREQRKDVLIIDGGLVRLPDQIALNSNLGCRAGVNLACLSETMILALEGEFRDYSIGSRIPLEDVEHLRRLGEKHGFGLAALHSFGREITEKDIADIINHGHQMTQASIS